MMTEKPQALIIDDNDMNSHILAMLLLRLNFETHILTSGEGVLDTIAQLNNLRVVFLDLRLPIYDGYAIHRQLREHGWDDTIPIVAYSAALEDIERVRSVGFDGFIGKPITASQFQNQMSRILSGESVWFIP